MSGTMAESWYYLHNQQQIGPVTYQDLLSKLSSGELPQNTSVWHETLTEWCPANTLSDFQQHASVQPENLPATIQHTDEPSSPEISAESFIKEDASNLSLTPHPWHRYWARIIDTAFIYLPVYLIQMLLLGIIIEVILYFLIGSASNKSNFFVYQWLAVIFVVPSYFLSEVIVLGLVGTTLGKLIFNISLQKDGNKPSFKDFLIRTLRLYVYGLGLLIPIVSLITKLYSYRYLEDNKTTKWDKDGGIVLRHHEISSTRIVLGILLGLVCSVGMGVLEILSKLMS